MQYQKTNNKEIGFSSLKSWSVMSLRSKMAKQVLRKYSETNLYPEEIILLNTKVVYYLYMHSWTWRSYKYLKYKMVGIKYFST